MRLNINNKSYVLLIRKFKLITLILLLAPMVANAQFSHRMELSVAPIFSIQTDNISVNNNPVHINRMGFGIASGIKYNLSNIPIGLYLGYEYTNFSDYFTNSSIKLYADVHELKIHNIDFDIQYLFLRQSTFKPYLFVGMSLNSVYYRAENLRYTNFYTPSGQYDPNDIINCGSILSKFSTFGLKFGVGINIRLSDRFGITGNVKFRYIPQSQTEWIDNTILTYTGAVGLHYRFLKK